MAYAYGVAYGANWLERVSSVDQRQDWAKRHEQEKKKRTGKGAAVVPNLGLAYSDLQDLIGIVQKHWEPIEPAFGADAKSETRALLVRFEKLRNTAMHSRTPLIYEQELMSGIAGQIRNQVTIFMSTQDQQGDYFPRVESIVDSFGTAFEGTPQKADTGNPLMGAVQSSQILTPGQVVTFTCVGVDPQDREIQFAFSKNLLLFLGWKKTTGGKPVTLAWEVKDSDISRQRMVAIQMKSVRGRYHRHGSHDQQVYFRYEVRPPTLG
jgi:hypothetical protein